MAEKITLAKQAGASPKKLALIGVLLVVLLGVLYVQFGRRGADDSPAPPQLARADRLPRRATARDGAAKAADGKEKTPEFLLESVDRRQWKSPALEEVTRYDPFALPAAFPQPAVATLPGVVTADGLDVADDAEIDAQLHAETIAAMKNKLAELQQRGVRVIIQGKNQATAVIGDRTVRVGDDVDGFVVKSIQPDGVVVERNLD